MATWKNISEDVFKINYPGDAGYSGKRRLTLQYDSETINPESVDVRFKWYQPGSSVVYGADIFYILYDANNTSDLRQLIKIKGYGSGEEEAYYTKSITLKKDCDSKTFFLQDIWICNSGGSSRSDADAAYDTFKSGGSRGSVANGSGGLVYRQSSGQDVSILPDKTVATQIGVGTTKIRDNKNNTFTITATKGANGTNNPAKELTDLVWGYTTNYGNSYTSGETKKLTISGTADTRVVYAKSKTTATYGYDRGVAVSEEINQYIAPTSSGKPVITLDANGRLTPKDRIIYNWTAATKRNNNSPVVGYRVRLYQKKAGSAVWKNIPIWSTTTNTQKSKLVNGEYIYDREVDDPTYISLGQEIHGFEVGDSVKLSIQAYSRFGDKNTGDNSTLLASAQVSDETLIENAGIMHIKVGGEWKEGQVYIKANGEWKEAESVHVKTSDGWKEST